jgi:hypothetical protein
MAYFLQSGFVKDYLSVCDAGIKCKRHDKLMTFTVRVSVSLLIFCLDVNYQSFIQRTENPSFSVEHHHHPL